MILFKSTAQKNREYSHWIDLTLNSHFEAVISEIYLTKIQVWSKSMFSGSTKRSKKVQRPQHRFVDQQKRGGGRAETKNAGVKKFSSFIWTLVVKTEKWRVNPKGEGEF